MGGPATKVITTKTHKHSQPMFRSFRVISWFVFIWQEKGTKSN